LSFRINEDSKKPHERKVIMTDVNTSIPVIAIIDPGMTRHQIMSALQTQIEFHLVTVIDSVENAAREIRATQPEIIIIDHLVADQPTLDLVDDLCIQFPEKAVITLLPEGDTELAQKVMFAGARAFLVQPFTQVDFLSTLRRVYALEERRRLAKPPVVMGEPSASEPLQIITVFSPRGGVGCSTVAINLAVALHEQIDGRTLLMEGKLHFGHLGLMLNVRPRNSLAELIPHSNALDAALIEDVVVHHATGIEVLLSPSNIEMAQGIKPDDMLNILRGVRPLYDFIVIDSGSFLNENTVTLMDLSDRILLVANPDLASLHDVSRFIQISRTLGYPPGKVLVVLNRAGMLGGVKTKDIEAALHQPPFVTIPEDGTKAIRSLNRGVPMYFKYPRNPVSRSIRHLAKALADFGVEEQDKSKRRSPHTILPKYRERFSPSQAS
jgi:pilus assembly protein CpaE